jgi:RES domain-containing protein
MAKPADDLGPPAGPLNATLIDWGKKKIIYRVHPERFAGDVFNPARTGNARFSPIVDPAGKVIPTLYAGSTLDCALMETVFHDVPYKAGFKPLSRTRLNGGVYTVLALERNLRLVDLGTIALRKLGISRNRLIDTTKAHYPRTRSWAESLYAQFPEAQGLRWTSRQDDHAQAIVLFRSRIPLKALAIMSPSLPLIEDGDPILPLIELATRIGVTLVD